MIHLRGMGLLGSLTAWRLYALNVPFTWEDAERPVNAWRASTGACYPSGGEVDARSHATWQEWVGSGAFPAGTLQVCAYWVDSVRKALPHKLGGQPEAVVGPLRLAGRSVHVNAQALVELTRKEFVIRRQTGSRPGDLVVTSHGFNHRLERYLWGWSRLVRLAYPPGVSRHGRPSFYLRKNRFQFAYCYPRPGTDWWYAGSSLINQVVAKELDPVPKYARWKQWFAELSGGRVTVVEEGEFMQGWRPTQGGVLKYVTGVAGKVGQVEAAHKVVKTPGGLVYPPMSSNGFRHFPLLWEQLEPIFKGVARG